MLASRRVNKFFIVPEKDRHPFGGHRIRWRIFHEYKPVSAFFDDDLASKKTAAIHLVESGLTTQTEAAEIVGLHRNTVSEAVRISKLLGVKVAIEDDRGCNGSSRITSAPSFYNLLNFLHNSSGRQLFSTDYISIEAWYSFW